jgi:CubicO group peptidase (beta-lactamase class C family)
MIRCISFVALLALLPTTSLFAQASPNRAKAMIGASIVFQPCVFFEDEFPTCEFLQPSQAHELLGDYKIEATFYSDNYEIVQKPTKPGRYGAIVKITAEDGTTFTRYRTLYKTPKRVSMFFGGIHGDVDFPASTGIDERTWNQQSEMVNDYISFAVGRDIQRSHDFAILLAGLQELGPSSQPATRTESASTKDRQWWLALKRKLNGNAERFAVPFVSPTEVDGLAARELRKGTEEEAGMKSGTVEAIDAVLTEWIENSDQPFNACVARRGVMFFDKAYGSRDGEPITTDTKHIVFSISKALSGSLLMMFVDRGLVSLDDPIENFLPEFERDGVETPATFHHLFTHTADMDGHFTDMQCDIEHIYGEAYPQLAIGKQHRYNGTSIGIGLKALEQITGLTLPELYKKYLFDPLGCDSIESIDGSAMTWSHAHDLARVGQMLANRGAYGNKRFFSEATFETMLPRKLDKLLGPDTDVTWGIGLTWFDEGGLSNKTIGHGSASSCTLRVDLENDLVITMTRATAGENFRKYHRRFIETVTGNIAE